MGYHTAAEIGNYWTYAQDFVLDDHMFEPVKSWSLPDHLYLVSGWSAKCSSPNPNSCVNEIRGPYTPAQMQEYVDQALETGTADVTNAWTDNPIKDILLRMDVDQRSAGTTASIPGATRN